MNRLFRSGFALLALLFSPPTMAAPPPARPGVVVLIVIDQFRGDYLTRFPNLFLPADSKAGVGGFRYLMDTGAYYPNARYTHFPLSTGPGHAVLSTGGTPATNGLIGNNWYVPAANGVPGHVTYCVDDPDSPIIGGSGPGISPRNLRSTTIGDELKMATGGTAQVLTVSLKDRAAVLLGGRLSDATIWYDNTDGRWVTSRFYRPDGRLPAWVEALNSRRLPDSYFNHVWTPLKPDAVAGNTWTPGGLSDNAASTVGHTFPHTFNGGASVPVRQYYEDFRGSPYANEFTLNTALAGIKAMQIGKDAVPDFVGINLTSNDVVGHTFGPNSPEAFDITIRTDRYLAAFFRSLDHTVPGGLKNVVIALSADHGVAPIPENMQASGFHAGRVSDDGLNKTINDALSKVYGQDNWIAGSVKPWLWIDSEAVARHHVDIRDVRRTAADAARSMEGVYDAFTRDQLLEGRTPDTPIAHNVVAGFHPKVSGDVVIITENLYYQGDGHGGTDHGTPWAYDTHVPIVLAGPGIKAGRYPRVASPQEIAPTLCAILGVDPPSACTAGVMVEALG